MNTLRTQPKHWFLAPVGPLVTQLREYVALHKVAASAVRQSPTLSRDFGVVRIIYG